jgi:hypothetical protein
LPEFQAAFEQFVEKPRGRRHFVERALLLGGVLGENFVHGRLSFGWDIGVEHYSLQNTYRAHGARLLAATGLFSRVWQSLRP